MRRIVIPALICFALCTLTFAYAQQSGTSREKTNDFYRVMSLAEMFEGDADAMKKVRSMMITVTRGDKATTVRTDMDAEDYERALNRLAAEGWLLVTVNKSNCWVFRRGPLQQAD